MPKQNVTPQRRKHKRRTPPYQAQSRLITPAELRFLHTGLQPAIGDRFYIGVQIPMTAVLKVDADQWDKSPGRKIRQKRLDFVLAYPKTFRIAAVIELDDKSHDLPERKKRDRFVERAFDAAGICLIRFPIYRKYDSSKIRSIVNSRLRAHRKSKRVS